MDPFQYLKKQHRELEQLFATFEEATAAKKKRALFEQIREQFEIHSNLEEKYLYALLVQHKQTQEQVNEAYEEHHSVDLLLNEVESLEPGDPAFTAKMTVAKEYIDHHVQEEEKELFPTAQRVLKEEELQALKDGLAAGTGQPTGV